MAHLGGVLNLQALPAEEIQSVWHGGRRGDHARAVLLLQALQKHLHVQQAQEAARLHRESVTTLMCRIQRVETWILCQAYEETTGLAAA